MQRKHYTQDELCELIKLVNNNYIIKGEDLQKFCQKYDRSIMGVREKIRQIRRKLNVNVRYTNKDLTVIKKCVKLYPYNLSLAFADAAAILNRPVKSVQLIYYRKIKQQKNVLFAMFGLKNFVTNCKNIPRNITTDVNITNPSKPNIALSILKKLKIF